MPFTTAAAAATTTSTTTETETETETIANYSTQNKTKSNPNKYESHSQRYLHRNHHHHRLHLLFRSDDHSNHHTNISSSNNNNNNNNNNNKCTATTTTTTTTTQLTTTTETHDNRIITNCTDNVSSSHGSNVGRNNNKSMEDGNHTNADKHKNTNTNTNTDASANTNTNIDAKAKASPDANTDPDASSSIPLFGRDKEMEELQEKYQTICQTGLPSSMFLVGPTGTGKTALVKKAFFDYQQQHKHREQHNKQHQHQHQHGHKNQKLNKSISKGKCDNHNAGMNDDKNNDVVMVNSVHQNRIIHQTRPRPQTLISKQQEEQIQYGVAEEKQNGNGQEEEKIQQPHPTQNVSSIPSTTTALKQTTNHEGKQPLLLPPLPPPLFCTGKFDHPSYYSQKKNDNNITTTTTASTQDDGINGGLNGDIKNHNHSSNSNNNNKNKPFSAWIDALEDLCQKLITRDAEERKQQQQQEPQQQENQPTRTVTTMTTLELIQRELRKNFLRASSRSATPSKEMGYQDDNNNNNNNSKDGDHGAHEEDDKTEEGMDEQLAEELANLVPSFTKIYVINNKTTGKKNAMTLMSENNDYDNTNDGIIKNKWVLSINGDSDDIGSSDLFGRDNEKDDGGDDTTVPINKEQTGSMAIVPTNLSRNISTSSNWNFYDMTVNRTGVFNFGHRRLSNGNNSANNTSSNTAKRMINYHPSHSLLSSEHSHQSIISQTTTDHHHHSTRMNRHSSIGVISSSQHPQHQSKLQTKPINWGTKRIQKLFRLFLDAVTKYQKVVLFLDDVQWSDDASMELILRIADCHRQQHLNQRRTHCRNHRRQQQQRQGQKSQFYFFLVVSTRTEELKDSNSPLKYYLQEEEEHDDEEQDYHYDDSHHDTLLSPLSSFVVSKQRRRHNKHCHQQRFGRIMKLDNLPLSVVNDFLAFLLEIKDPTQTLPLAQVVWQKTLGNPLFIVECLELLLMIEVEVSADLQHPSNHQKQKQQHRPLLYYNYLAARWEWDLELIRSEINLVADGAVLDVVAGKIQRLPKETQEILMLAAACFGNRFDAHVIYILLLQQQDQQQMEGEHHQNVSDLQLSNQSIGSMMQPALDFGLVNKVKPQQEEWVYRFSHDRIQNAAYSLVRQRQADEEEDVNFIHLCLGKALKRLINSEYQREWMLLVAVDQLNKGSNYIEQDIERVELAHLNFEAAQQVRYNSAFFAAAEYLDKSIRLLGDQRWDTQYELTLEITSLSAEMEYCCGQFQKCKARITDILVFGRSIEDKLSAYFTLVYCHASQRSYDAVFEIGKIVLSLLRHPVPKRVSDYHIATESRKTKRLLRQKSDEELMEIEQTNEIGMIAILKMLSILAFEAWHASKNRHFAFVVCRLVRLSIRFGFTQMSAVAFGLYGVVLIRNGEYRAGNRFGLLSLKISDKFQATECGAKILVTYHAFIHHMFRPLHDGLEPLLYGHQLGMSSGDIGYGQVALTDYTIIYFFCGLPLAALDKDTHGFIEEMKEYQQSTTLNICRVYRQLTHNLMGHSPDPLLLEGEEIDDLNDLLDGDEDFPNLRTDQTVIFAQMILAYHFGDYTNAKYLVERHQQFRDLQFPASYSYFIPFFQGLIWLALKKRRKALVEIKKVRRWVKHGFINCHHLLLILRAEYAAMCNKNSVKKQFEEAIQVSKRSGFSQNEALANERLGVYFIDRDPEWASFYLSRAMELYKEWGARAKARHLESTFGAKIEFGNGVDGGTPSTHIHGRSRFNREQANRHKEHDWIKATSIPPALATTPRTRSHRNQDNADRRASLDTLSHRSGRNGSIASFGNLSSIFG